MLNWTTLGMPQSSRYTLSCELGRGGMGVVYVGHDNVRDMPVRDMSVRDMPMAHGSGVCAMAVGTVTPVETAHDQ